MTIQNIIAIKALRTDEIYKIEKFRKPKQASLLAISFFDGIGSTYATEKLEKPRDSKLRHICDEQLMRTLPHNMPLKTTN